MYLHICHMNTRLNSIKNVFDLIGFQQVYLYRVITEMCVNQTTNLVYLFCTVTIKNLAMFIT